MKPSYICRYLQSHAHPQRLAVPNGNSWNFLKGNHSHHLHTGVQTHCEPTLSGREPMLTEVNHSSNKNNQHWFTGHCTAFASEQRNISVTKNNFISVVYAYIIIIIYITLTFKIIYYSIYMIKLHLCILLSSEQSVNLDWKTMLSKYTTF